MRWDAACVRSWGQREKAGESGRPSLEPPRTVEPPSSEAPISGEGISDGQCGSGVESSERMRSVFEEGSSCRFDGSALGSSGREQCEPTVPASSGSSAGMLGS